MTFSKQSSVYGNLTVFKDDISYQFIQNILLLIIQHLHHNMHVCLSKGFMINHFEVYVQFGLTHAI